MSQVLLWSGVVLEVVILAGLAVRGRVSYCYSLPVFLVAVMLSTSTVGLCPSCNTWDFWIAKELVHAVLFLVMGLELSVRLFRYLPEARLWARVCVVVVVVGAVLLLAVAPAWRPVSVELLPRLLAALAWLYAGLLAVTVWHDLPMERLHKAILWGFSPWLMLYALTWSRTGEDTRVANLVNPLMAALALLVLAWAAWSRPPEPAADRETLKVVWPWRS